MKMGGIEKGERKIEEKMLFSFIWFKRENKREIKQSGKNHFGLTNFYSLD